MNKNSFFAGLEEVVARLASLILTILFFIIYASARQTDFQLNWLGILQMLILFWFIYEILGFMAFQAFKFFSAKQAEIKVDNSPISKPEVVQNNTTLPVETSVAEDEGNNSRV